MSAERDEIIKRLRKEFGLTKHVFSFTFPLGADAHTRAFRRNHLYPAIGALQDLIGDDDVVEARVQLDLNADPNHDINVNRLAKLTVIAKKRPRRS